VDNQDIDRFFTDSGLMDRIDRQDRPPTATWIFQAGRFPVLIQTQENANRMRIVAFIGDAAALGRDEMTTLLEANYHTALDARYALADDQLVAVFLHPFRELTLTQFILGLYQTVNCAETCGSTFTGGTMVFGSSGGDSQTPRPRPRPEGAVEDSIDRIMHDVVRRISEST
jgi:hypothetical protein